jgi:hypothetical protein
MSGLSANMGDLFNLFSTCKSELYAITHTYAHACPRIRMRVRHLHRIRGCRWGCARGQTQCGKAGCLRIAVVCMYLCMYACMYACLFVHAYAHFLKLFLDRGTFTRSCMLVYICKTSAVYICICICIYTWTCQ